MSSCYKGFNNAKGLQMTKRILATLLFGCLFSFLFFLIEKYFMGHTWEDSIVSGVVMFLALLLTAFLLRPIKKP
jgi:ABC-type uncharacterized transport system permease subunit